jgi:hypothetical protein
MEQPITLHWQSQAAYATAVLTPDLFGSWVLITANGKRDGRAGRVRHTPLPSYAEGLTRLDNLRRKRRSEGFALCTTGFLELDDLDPHSASNRYAETHAVLRAFRNLAIPLEQQAVLLAVDLSEINAFLDGKTLPDLPQLLGRVRLIMAIHKALHLLFGGALEQARSWLVTPHPRFAMAQPLALMLANLDGLKIVRAYLEGEVDALFEQPPSVVLPRDRACTGERVF